MGSRKLAQKETIKRNAYDAGHDAWGNSLRRSDWLIRPWRSQSNKLSISSCEMP